MQQKLRFKSGYIDEIIDYIKPNEKLSKMFENCFYSTLDRSVIWNGQDKPFVITGDIYAMWLRDSTAEVLNYTRFCKENPLIKKFICGVIYRQISNIMYDPYANAFNENENNLHCRNDETDLKPGVWERKYEVDSLCYAVRLIYSYVSAAKELPYFSENENTGENVDNNARAVGEIASLFRTVIQLWKTEQRHFEKSPYRFTRRNTAERDTIHNEGMGNPVNYTGMTWSGFRPSDDACVFGYLIPSNFFAASVLENMEEIAVKYLDDYDIASKARELKDDILRGINTYGIYRHPVFGKIYAYETDGFGNYTLSDDANSPSLLSLPLLCGSVIDNDIYANTRKFVLSGENPNFISVNGISGIGSVHTPKNYIWHLSLIYQALTSDSEEEICRLLDTLISTDANTCYMHESFNAADPKTYTRSHFSWADSAFAELIMKVYDNSDLRHILCNKSV